MICSNKSLLLLIFFCIINLKQYASDLHVGVGQPYTTIQAAVNNASEKDVIIIHEGIYREEIKIGVEGLTFQPNGADTVTINGAEIITGWTHEGNNVYSAIVDWDITQEGQSNQVFIDGEMLHLLRWPKRPVPETNDFVTDYETGIVEGAQYEAYNTINIVDSDYSEGGFWEGAMIWINLSNPLNKKDGQGYTTEVMSINGTEIKIESDANVGNDNWGIDNGTRYYLFDPLPSKVEAYGGIISLLGNGEWWKHHDTLYVKTKNGDAPSMDGTGNNVVEMKKRIFAFKPSKEARTLNNTTIRDINLFAASITTDHNYSEKTIVSQAKNNIINGINAKYISHFVDLTGDWISQWSGRSGIILTGTNNVLKNSTFEYCAGSAVSCLGSNNKIHNNLIDHCNYQVTESGSINFGYNDAYSFNHDIGYNTISNTPHVGICIRGLKNQSLRSKGRARIHHNTIHDGLTRVHDGGLVHGEGNYNWLRIDHNIMYNSTDFLQIGIYLDYGDPKINDVMRILIDHNILYNINHPIQINHCNDYRIYNNTIRATNDYDGLYHYRILNNDAYIINNIIKNHTSQNAVSLTNYYNSTWSEVVANPSFTSPDFQLVETSATVNNIINKGTELTLFSDPLDDDTIDLGAYEYGKQKWITGYYGNTYSKVSEPVFSVNEGTYSNVNLTLSTATPGATIRYTKNGRTPTTTYGTIYTKSINISSNCEIKAIAYKEGQPESFLVTKEYKITTPRTADTITNKAPGLKFVAHPNATPGLVDFNFLPVQANDSGITENITLDATNIDNDFGMQFSGYLNIHETGEYTFYSKSDDGMQLYIGNSLVIDNTGESNEELKKEEISGTIALKAGFHPITVEYYECDFIVHETVQDEDIAMLHVKYSGPGFHKQNIPDVRLFHDNPNGVDVEPEISIIEPIDSTYIETGLEYSIIAEAFDRDGLDSVIFSINGNQIYTDTVPPYKYNKTFTADTYTIRTDAYDTMGNSHSDSITVFAEDYDIISIIQTHDTILLDGQMENTWNDDTLINIINVNSGTITNENDLSGSYKIQYTSQGLYLFVNVLDDDLSTNHNINQISQNDGIEVFLDLNNGKTPFYEENDYHYIFSANGDFKEQAHQAIKDVDFIINTNPTGYTMEVFIPWKTINKIPIPDTKIGLDIKIIDNDNNTFEGKLSWWESTSDIASKSTSIMGIGIFKDNIKDLKPPETPVIIGPSDNSIVKTHTPGFKWEHVSDHSGILHYEINIGGTSYYISGLNTEYSLTSQLSNGNYNWKIRAMDTDSNAGAWSSNYNLIIDDTYNDTIGPDAPVLLTPYNGVNLDSIAPEFNWQSVYDADGIERYEIQINENILDVGNQTYCKSHSLLYNDSTWRVRAIDINGNAGAWSQTRKFNLKGVFNLALNKDAFAESTMIGLTSIHGGNDGDYLTRWGSEFHVPTWYIVDLEKKYEIHKVVFNWESMYARAYQLQVGMDTTNWRTIYSFDSTLTETYHDHYIQTITGLSDSGRYVRMYATEKSVYGVSFWEFEVYGGTPIEDTIAPGTPELLMPLTGDTIGDCTPLFKWKKTEDTLSGIKKYEICIDDTIYDAGKHDFFNASKTLSNNNHTWKLRAIDYSGNIGEWSIEQSFVINNNDSIEPSAPELHRPLSGHILSGQPVLFIWKASLDESGIKEYEIQINDSIYKVGDTLETTIYVKDSNNLVWKVRAIDKAGNIGPWSEEWFASILVGKNKYQSATKKHVHPNPVKNILNIPGELNITQIKIVNIYGSTVYNMQSDLIESIDVSFLAKGMYFLICQSKNQSFKYSFIKN
jgi:hypothetical protein